MPLLEQLQDPQKTLCMGNWSRLIGRVFTEEDAPRWVFFWQEALPCCWTSIPSLREGIFRLTLMMHSAAQKGKLLNISSFISAETLCPDGESGDLLHEKIEEQSHRFAHGVTENLQWAVREAIEVLANEWVEDRRSRKLPYTRRLEKGAFARWV